MSDSLPPGDRAERYYSPPPPQGFRGWLREHRARLIGLAVVIAIVAGLGARAALDDGKGSGNLERAFGGITEEDTDDLAEFMRLQRAAGFEIVQLFGATAERDIRAMKARARIALDTTTEAGTIVPRIDNDDLRPILADITSTRQRMARSFLAAADYVAAHPGTPDAPRARTLARRAEDSVMEVAEAEMRFFRRIRPYMNDEQRETFRREQDAWQNRFSQAVGE